MYVRVPSRSSQLYIMIDRFVSAAIQLECHLRWQAVYLPCALCQRSNVQGRRT